jgi:hypothetical protein
VGLSQVEFATRLGVPEQTYRTWDSGRRTPPRSIVYKPKRFKETAGWELLSMQFSADEYRMHVRTLRKAAQLGRLQATFSTRMAFGKLVAFANRDAVETFKHRYYRQTTQWNRTAKARRVYGPRRWRSGARHTEIQIALTQSALADRIGAANKAVV